MMATKNNNSCRYHLISFTYELGEVKNTFREYKQCSSEESLIPELIRIEKNNGYNTFSGANNLLRFRDAKNWQKCTRVDLRPTGSPSLYYTDVFVRNTKALCMVYYPKISQTLKIYIFPAFYPCPRNDFRRCLNEASLVIKNTIEGMKGDHLCNPLKKV
jgi:hypothetical protein